MDRLMGRPATPADLARIADDVTVRLLGTLPAERAGVLHALRDADATLYALVVDRLRRRGGL